MDNTCKITTFIIAVAGHASFAVPLTVDLIIFCIFVASTHTQLVFHGSDKLFWGVTINCPLVLTIDNYIIAFFWVIFYPAFLIAAFTPSVYAASFLSFSLILPIESLAVPVGLRRHKMVLIFNMSGLTHGIRDAYHITSLIIAILNECFIFTSISRQEYNSSYF